MLVMTGANLVFDLNIASNNTGGAIIVWSSQADTQSTMHAQSVNAAGDLSWGISGVPISTFKGSFIEAVPDGNGGAYLAWLDDRASITYSNSYVQHIASDGIVQWQDNGLATKLSTLNQQWQEIIADGSGGAFVTFAEWVTGNHTITYSQQLNSTGLAWANSVVVTTGQGWQYSSSMALNNSGGIIVAWSDQRNEGDVYAQNICSTGALGNCVLGLPEITSDSMLSVYPNPSDGNFTVTSLGILDRIIVTDVLGKVIFSIVPASEETTIALPDANSGIYFAKLVSGNREVVKKLIFK